MPSMGAGESTSRARFASFRSDAQGGSVAGLLRMGANSGRQHPVPVRLDLGGGIRLGVCLFAHRSQSSMSSSRCSDAHSKVNARARRGRCADDAHSRSANHHRTIARRHWMTLKLREALGSQIGMVCRSTILRSLDCSHSASSVASIVVSHTAMRCRVALLKSHKLDAPNHAPTRARQLYYVVTYGDRTATPGKLCFEHADPAMTVGNRATSARHLQCISRVPTRRTDHE